ncbi:proteinase-activated receptor 1-like isoform X3 [Thalassophryne amazonica]|uniref:proteinase-activated receptor 1-like isoform X2 n=1 Tax=Thalassophryne amazonica TaxID=390379 RepID=UPI0014715FB9|nr:proteinase-activated receptor 1-like isoform X2 [Thalassophryne amazonica]XP_034048366.1 proteinase-activated receptor 1-like isoform X3 [Thalassophryne amazonica]
MFLQALLLLLFSVSAAQPNGTAGVRTFSFSLFDQDADKLDVEHYFDPLDAENHSRFDQRRLNTNTSNHTNIRKKILSDEAVLFLTGPLSTIFIPSFYTVVCLLSVPLNAIAIVTFALQIKPKKPAVVYMLNLACADLLFVMLLPFNIFYHFNGNNWTLGPLLCRVVTAAFYCNMYCCVLLIACISVDRLLAVVYPIESLSWRHPQVAITACVFMWVLALAGSVPLVLSEQTVDLPDLGIITCHNIQRVDEIRWYYKIYFITICCTLFFLPLLITAASYTRVIWTLSRVPHGVEGRSRRKTRALVLALTVLVIFVLCFTPTNCLLLVHYLHFTDGESAVGSKARARTYAAYLVCMCLGSLNCCLDPLVYYFGSSQFQRQISIALRCQKISAMSSSRSTSRTILKSNMISISKTNTPAAKKP